jgi:restriction endonuclease S subunit
VLIALNGQGKTRGAVALLRTEATCNQSLVAISPDTSKLLPEYLYYVLKSMYQQIRDLTGDGHRSGLNMPIIRSIEIPLPPIEVQLKIVADIKSKQEAIDHAREIIAVLERERELILTQALELKKKDGQ